MPSLITGFLVLVFNGPALVYTVRQWAVTEKLLFAYTVEC